MKIVILNGSPKGEYSITLQYVRFLEKRCPGHEYRVLHVAKEIKMLEKNGQRFAEAVSEVADADLVIWAFGLWVLAVSAQYMRFIELVNERGVAAAFKGKHAAAISTSINYFDHTAHNYMRGVCEDLQMSYIDGISLDIMDLRDADKREKLAIFGDAILTAAEQKVVTSRLYYPIRTKGFDYRPGPVGRKTDTAGRRVLILTDNYAGDGNLKRMIDRLRLSFEGPVEIIDLHDIDIRGACLGCMKCGYDYQCQYRDGFRNFYNGQVMSADLIIMAGEIKGRFLSSLWKTFFDRAFFWNHTPSLERKQIAYLVSGPVSRNENLCQILEANVTARQNANFIDIISDEYGDSEELDALLESLAARMMQMSLAGMVKPQNFLAVGGHKIFRDNIWGRLRGIWQADHRHYRKNGYYDFPQYNLRFRIMGNLLLLMSKLPGFRRKLYDNARIMPSKRFSRLIDKLTVSTS